LSSIEKLPHLKKLKLMRLMPIKSSSLQELHFSFDSSEDEEVAELIQIAVNCPNLRVLGTSSLVWIDFIFLHFPRLEGLKCHVESCWGNNIHQHLKHLQITSNSIDVLFSIVNRCEVLESLSTCFNFNQTSLKDLLISKPGLKSLFLKCVNVNMLETINDFGGHLEAFHCTSSRNFVDLQMLETELKDVFNEFQKQGHIHTAKKKGTAVSFKFD
jgi:hypothetical protein